MTSQYTIDPAHTSLQFSVRHLMISNVRGTFTGVSGTVSYDASDPNASRVEATVDVNTINTNEPQRDTHLKSADFFDAAQFPTVTFRSTKFEKKGVDEFTVTGDLTLHGVTKPVTLEVTEVSPEGKDLRGNTRVGAAVKTKIKRSEFGLSWNAPMETGGVVISDDVRLDFEVELLKAQSAAA